MIHFIGTSKEGTIFSRMPNFCEPELNSIFQTLILIHFPRFQLVFDSQLEEIPKDVECAKLFILDQIH